MLNGYEKINQEIAKRQKIEDDAYDGFVRAVEASYKTFLERDQLTDIPVVRIGFYSILDQIVNMEPYTIPPVQKRLEDYLVTKQVEAMEEMMDDTTDLLRTSVESTVESTEK